MLLSKRPAQREAFMLEMTDLEVVDLLAAFAREGDLKHSIMYNAIFYALVNNSTLWTITTLGEAVAARRKEYQ